MRKLIPDAQKRRMEAKGVLGVALQGAAGVSGGTEGRASGIEVATTRSLRFPANGLSSSESVCAERRVADVASEYQASHADSQFLGVAKQASGNPAFGLQVGSNGGGASPFLSSPPFPSDDRFADNIARAFDRRTQ